MKTSCSLLFALLVCGVASNSVVPVLAAPAKKLAPSLLPAEVRAMMAPDAKTLRLVRFPIGPKGIPLLLHAWTIGRRSSATPLGVTVPALFCIDLFYRDKDTHGKWQLASSTSYVADGPTLPLNDPNALTYTTRWLHPATKQGLVIVETAADPTGSTTRLITLPDGVPHDPISAQYSNSVQEFYSYYSGGSVSISFGTDSAGDMTIEEQILPHAVAPETRNTYAWREGRWIKVATRKISQPRK